MGYILLLGCLVLAFFKPDSKKVTFLIAIYLWLLYALNTHTPDGVIYEKVYNSRELVESFYYEPAYSLLMMLCRWLGLPFQGFRIVLASLYVPLLYWAVRRMTPYTAYVMALFAVFPLTYFYSVLRSGFASLIILFGLGYLMRDDSRGGWKYLGCVAAAMMFHLSSALFLVLLYACKKLQAKWLLLLVGCMFIGCALIRFTDIPYRIVSSFTDSDRLLTWVQYDNDGDPNLNGYIGMAAAVLGSECIAGLLRRALRNTPGNPSSAQRKEQLMMADTVYRADAAMLILMPLLVLSSVYIRFVYQLFAANLCLCANVSAATAKKTGKGKFITVASLLGLLWTVGYMVYANHPFTLAHLKVYDFESNLLSALLW